MSGTGFEGPAQRDQTQFLRQHYLDQVTGPKSHLISADIVTDIYGSPMSNVWIVIIIRLNS